MTDIESFLESALLVLEKDTALHPSEKARICDRLIDQARRAQGVFLAQWEKQMEREYAK